jgi:hypothetical protein
VQPTLEAWASAAQNAGVRLLCPLAVLVLTGCGLLPGDEVGFRTYPLKDTTLPEAAQVVNDTTRVFALDHFGGIGMSWDPVDHNLVLDPVYDGQRRMRLYIHLEPEGADVNVEMFALVETLHSDAGAVGWSDPQQDVPLEEQLYQAFIAALVARRGGAP